MAIGYLKRPDLNSTRFINSPVPVNGNPSMRLYKTGDWGYLLSDGHLEICGRCDSMVKIRGYSVEIQVEILSANLHITEKEREFRR